MSAYFSILKIRMKALFQYRAAAFAAICAQTFWGIILTTILRTFYQGATSAEPLSLQQTLTFIWIGQALINFLPWTIDKEVEAQIKNGNVAYELVRPLHLYGFWFARSCAMRLAPTLLRCFPVFILGGWLFGFHAPVSLGAGAFFLLSLILALLLSSAMTAIALISLFWTISGEGIQRLLPTISFLLAGMIVPLPLFPNWLKPFLDWQPFRGIMDIPCRLYTGVIPLSKAWLYLGFQVSWIAIFMFLGWGLMNRAMRKFIIQGG